MLIFFYYPIIFSLRRRFNLTCTVFKFFRATSPDLRLTQLSMRRMNASMVAMVWMGQFIWLPAPGCPTGEARLTKGYSLKAKYVIHTVGPVWFEESDHESRLLENCYRNSLQLAVEHDIRTIAFPAISTGAYGFPPGPAARIAMGTTREFLESGNHSMEVTFVCFDEGSLRHYEAQI